MPKKKMVAYKRKRTGAPKRPTRNYKKRRLMYMGAGVPKLNRLSTQRFVQKAVIAGNDVVSSGSVTYAFALNDIATYTEFTSLFDQYQIVGIKYRWVLTQDPSVNSQTAAAKQGAFPYIKWVHDHDDSGTATEAQIQQYPKMHEHWFSESKKATRWFFLKPAVAAQAYGPISNGYTARWRQWMDSGYPGTPHYGLKAYYNILYTGVNLLLETKYVLKLKSII